MRWPRVILGSTLLLSLSAPGRAQEIAEPLRRDRVSLGPVTLAPAVRFDLALDTNVFNAPDEPRHDMTWTLAPGTQARMAAGRIRLTGSASTELVRFERTGSENSINFDTSTRISAAWNRVQPYVSASFLSTRQRPSIEIDLRSQRHERSLSIGTLARLSRMTTVEVTGTTSDVAFDAGAIFLGTSLRQVLNRTTTRLGAAVRHQLTTVTTVTMAAEVIEERFAFSADRDSTGIRVVPGVQFGPSALVAGSASAGYRRLHVSKSSVPEFTGLVASVSLGYTLLGSTRFELQARRDVEYSGDSGAPYYVVSGVGGGLTRQLADRLGITMRVSRFQSRFPGAVPGADPRIDTLVLYGGGIIRKVGRNLQVGINADYYRRLSSLIAREYSGLRAGTSFAYGF